MLSRLERLARQSVRRLRHGVSERRARSQASRAIRHVRALRSTDPQRKLVGIFLVEHIGDIVACEPVVGWARRAHPDACLVWVVKHEFRELLLSHPRLDAVLGVTSLAAVAPMIRSGVFDESYDLHVNHKPTGLKNLEHIKHWGEPRIDGSNYFGYGTILRAFSRGAGISVPGAAPQLHVPDHVVRSVDLLRLPPRFVVVHTTSNDHTKNWSPAGWRELVNHVCEAFEIPVFEVGLTTTVRSENERFSSLCGRLSLLETAEVVRRSTFFIGVDSAVAHMANAWRIPSLLLFGHYKGEGSWTPYEGFFAEQPDRWIVRHDGPLNEQVAPQVVERLKTVAHLRLQQLQVR
jgi:heptosyltransferase-3